MRTRVIAALAALLGMPAAALAQEPGTPEYAQRDLRNMQDAYGRQTAPDGQFANLGYHRHQVLDGADMNLSQLVQQAENPTRLALTPGNVFPGWNTGNPLRRGWDGTRGQMHRFAYTNRHGALIRGGVFAPLAGARDPYSGRRLRRPFPGVVITTGSVQGSERMYWWLAQDLAERGYVVLTYDVQGQGTSETLPHEGEPADLPFCDPAACPGVPSQQDANFVEGTEDALTFFLSTPEDPYPNRNAGSARVNTHNPLWKLIDRRPDDRTATPGRTTKVAIVGHSLGASAVSQVQATDERVAAIVALDKLRGSVKPVVPALAVQSEYGFFVTPYWMSGGSSIAPQPGPPDQGPDPARERATGFDAWRAAGVDAALIVPRASTHLEYTDIPYALPASRYGQALTSVYTQAWLDRYLKHRKRAARRLTATSWRYQEPVGDGRWQKIRLEREPLLSFYHCSAFAFGDFVDGDIGGVGCP